MPPPGLFLFAAAPPAKRNVARAYNRRQESYKRVVRNGGGVPDQRAAGRGNAGLDMNTPDVSASDVVPDGFPIGRDRHSPTRLLDARA